METMFARLRACFAGFAVLMLLLIAPACGPADKPPPVTPTAAVSESHDASALTRSAANTTAATSFSATFHADVDVNGKTVNEDGRMEFRAPSAMYMKITVADQVIELLVNLPDEYINIPGKGWYSMGEYVVNADAYAKYAKNRGPVDYAGIVNGLTDSRQLDDDEIDGKRYLHYSGTFDPKKAIDQLPQDLLKPGIAGSIKALGFQPGTMDVLIDPDTNLPRRGVFDMTMKFADRDMTIHMAMEYAGWNEPVDMPNIPKDAKPYSELTGGLSPADVSYQLQCSNWLINVGDHMAALGEFANKPFREMSSDERTRLKNALVDIAEDVTTLEGMSPTSRFHQSYDKLLAAIREFHVATIEVEKNLESPGTGDDEAENNATKRGVSLFQEGTELFKQESSGLNP